MENSKEEPQFDPAKTGAIKYVNSRYPLGATKGLHIKTTAQYAYEQGYKDGSASLQKQLDEAKEGTNITKKAHDQLRDKLEEYKTNYSALEAQNQALINSDIEQLEIIFKLREKLNEVELFWNEESAKQINNLRKSWNEAVKKLEESESDLSITKSSRNTCYQTINELNEIRGGLEAEIKELKEKNEGQAMRIGMYKNVDDEIEKYTEDIDSLQKELIYARSVADDYKTAFLQEQAKVEKCESEKHSLIGQITSLTEQLYIKESQNAKLVEALKEEANNRISDVTEQLNSLVEVLELDKAYLPKRTLSAFLKHKQQTEKP